MYFVSEDALNWSGRDLHGMTSPKVPTCFSHFTSLFALGVLPQPACPPMCSTVTIMTACPI